MTPPDIQFVEATRGDAEDRGPHHAQGPLGPAYMCSALFEYSTRLDPATLGLIRTVLAVRTFEDGLVAQHATDEV